MIDHMKTDDPIRVTEAARRLGITSRDAYDLIDRGELAPIRVEGEWPMVSAAQVDALLDARATS